MTVNKMIGFIGGGNMATALVKGLVQSGLYDPALLSASDKSEEALKRISSQFGIQIRSSNRELVRQASLVVLSVKPQNMREVLEEVKDEVVVDHLVVSIAAGIPLKMIGSIIGEDIPMIRVMPNTPALVQQGMSALARGQQVTDEHMVMASRIFSAVGDTVEVEESMMDAITAVSGSGPGFLFRIMECMVDGGVAAGLERDTSLRLVVQTCLGAAHLAKESEHSLSRLREMVTSPGGTTAAGLAVFEEMGIDKVITSAIKAACKRSVELGRGD
jgi:pyrroline-5-carboxylate reductase